MAEQDVTVSEEGPPVQPERMPETFTESADLPVPEETLNRRQAAIGERRRQGGPRLVEEELQSSSGSLSDEPTECEPASGDTGP